MREYTYTLRDALINGLRPDDRVPLSLQYLEDVYGMKPTPLGLIGLEDISFPVTGHSQTASTQLLEGKGALYLVDVTGGNVVLKAVNLSTWAAGSDELTGGQVPSIVDDTTLRTLSTARWHHAAASNIFIASNGTSMFTNAPLYDSWAGGALATEVIPSAVCYSQALGRLFMGGLATGGSYFAGATWLEIWNTFRRATPLTRSDTDAIDKRFVLVGMPGGGATDKPFSVELCAISGYDYADLREVVLSAARRGAMQLVEMPFRGDVLRLLPLRNGQIVVYGANEVGYLSPGDGAYVPTTFHHSGLLNRNAVDGDDTTHVFVDAEGDVWSLSGEGPVKLGFREYISTLTNPWVVFDRRLREAYITDATTTYLLTDEQKLCRSDQHPRSLIDGGSATYGTYTADSEPTHLLLTHPFNFGRRGINTLRSVEVEQEGCTSKMIRSLYKYTSSGTYKQSTNKPLNREDVAFLITKGVSQKVKMTFSATRDSFISNLRVKWTSNDFRNIRGLLEGSDADSNR